MFCRLEAMQGPLDQTMLMNIVADLTGRYLPNYIFIML